MKKRSLMACFCCLLLAFLTNCAEPSKKEITTEANDDLALLPRESNFVFFCDLQKINASEMGQKLVQDMRVNIDRDDHRREFDRFQEATGLDPLKDFQSILVAGQVEESRRDNNFAAVLRGSFDHDKIMSYAREKVEEERRDIPWTTETISGRTVYTVDENDDPMSFCFVNSSTVYFGSSRWVRETLENKPAKSLKDRADFMDALRNHIAYGDQFWFSVDAEAMEHQSMGRSLRHNVPAAENVKALYFSAKTSDLIAFNGKILCDNAESSQLLVDMMKGALAAAKLSVSNERKVVDELNKIEIFQEGMNAVLRGEITQVLIKSLEDRRDGLL